MCGIAGIVRFDSAPVDAGVLGTMARAIQHRGPDGEGIKTWGAAGFAHRRLAIIDPAGGVQPLSNEDGSIWITFNGEIYNFRELLSELTQRGHQFRTRSDTEVVVHAYEEWGLDFLQRLRGMFAIALWDNRRRKLILARDRVGIKPLYYLHTPELLAFASELQALETLPEFSGELDPAALDLYLHLQYIPAPFSIYRDVRKLCPGEVLELDADGTLNGPVRYWNLTLEPEPGLSQHEWIERLDAGLREAVRLHLVSDVPVGSFLSGGVDSSTVTAYMASELQEQVHTFSVTFDDPEYDESPFAREAAQRLGTRHFEERVQPDALSILPTLVRHYGEPFADSSAVPTYYLSRLASRHVKCILSGDGGDENFAGYSSYASILWQHRLPSGVYRKMRHAVGGLLRSAGLRRSLPAIDDSWFENLAYFRTDVRQNLWRPEFHGVLEQSRSWFDDQMRSAPRARGISRYQHFDLHNYLPYDILTKVDVASMAHGLEVRVPLLDHVFMELVARVPESLKLRANDATGAGSDSLPGGTHGMTGKYLLKKLAGRFFPGSFIHRRKQGFSIPVKKWFRSDLLREIDDRLTSSGNRLEEYFDVSWIRGLVNEHSQGVDHSWRLWSLLFLSEWLNQRDHSPRTAEPVVLGVATCHGKA